MRDPACPAKIFATLPSPSTPRKYSIPPPIWAPKDRSEQIGLEKPCRSPQRIPRNLDSGAKIGLATFVATSVGFGPQGGRGDSNPRPLGSESRVLDHWAPGGHFPWGIVPPGESPPWDTPPWGIVPQGNHPPGRHPPGESPPRGIIPLGETSLGNRPPGDHPPGESPPWGIVPLGNLPLGNDFPGESPPWGIVPLGNRPIYVFVHGPILYFLPRPGWSRITSKS